MLPATLLEARPPDGRLTVKGLEEAAAAGFIVEHGERLAISHELCAEAVEALALTPERQALHAAIAESTHRRARTRGLALGSRRPPHGGA